MKSRGPGGTPRQEPARRSKEPEAPPPVKTERDELRAWGLCRAFVHQFKKLAERLITPQPTGKKRRKGEGDRRSRWQRYKAYKTTAKPRQPPRPPAPQETATIPRPFSIVQHIREALYSAFTFD
jgi:hypothetical protein